MRISDTHSPANPPVVPRSPSAEKPGPIRTALIYTIHHYANTLWREYEGIACGPQKAIIGSSAPTLDVVKIVRINNILWSTPKQSSAYIESSKNPIEM